MQVTVPDGVFPGMPFQVETPTGPMQVTAPPGSQPGGQMLVNVPAAPVVVVAAMPVADAAPVSVSAAAMPVADAAPVSVSAAVVSAPQPQQMSGTVRLDDIQDGWYGLEGCPTCCCMRIAFNHDKSAFSQGPCCCWQLPIGARYTAARRGKRHRARGGDVVLHQLRHQGR